MKNSTNSKSLNLKSLTAEFVTFYRFKFVQKCLKNVSVLGCCAAAVRSAEGYAAWDYKN